jgi:putative tricarboxylic transport membrane protein
MDLAASLLLGIEVALRPENLLVALVGSALGMLVGVLPGLGPTAAAALLLPISLSLDVTPAVIMLAAVYYGSQFGGTITSVLLNVPGEASSAVTCLDGHPLARQGRAGAVLTIAAVGSAFGGIAATAGLVVAAPLLVGLALRFGPPEQFALMVFAVALLLGLAGSSPIKGLMMAVLGLLLATIGLDPTEGRPRFTFGEPALFDGLSFVPVVMGLFGLADILLLAEQRARLLARIEPVGGLMPDRTEMRDSVAPVLRGTGIGFALGLVPGMLPSVSAFLSYVAERALSPRKDRFGKGAIEGVAGPESANNAHVNASLIPLFTLGIPTTPTIAIILGAFLLKGVVPGPLLFRDQPDVAWGVIVSFFVGNVILLVWSIPLVSIWVAVLRVPQAILAGFIVVFMLVGAYAESGTMFGVWVLLGAGLFGYAFRKLGFPAAPLVLALVIGPLMEQTLIQSLEMFAGDATELFRRPIVLTLLAAAAVIVAVFSASALSGLRKASADAQ